MSKRLDPRGTMQPSSTLVPLRGPSGRLYGMLDPQTLTIEVKRKGEQPERIDLKPHLEQK
jgi:hypothetical protein